MRLLAEHAFVGHAVPHVLRLRLEHLALAQPPHVVGLFEDLLQGRGHHCHAARQVPHRQLSRCAARGGRL